MTIEITNKKQNDKLVTVALIGLALWQLGLKYLYAVQRLLVKPWRLAFPNTNIDGFEVDLYFAVKNPTAIQLTFSGFRGHIFLNNAEITEVAVPKQIIPSGISELQIAFFVTWQQLGRNIVPALLQSNLSNSVISIDGDFYIGGYTIPINRQIPVSELSQS